MKTRSRQLLCGAVLIPLCLLLTACVEVQLKFELRADGSGVAGWTVEIPKGTAESLGMTAEKVKEQMLKDRQFQKPGVQTSIGRAPNGNDTVTVTMPFTSVQELSSDDMRFEFQKSPDGRQCTFGIKTSAQPVPIQVRAEVHMPGRITNSNADAVSGNVARYNNVLRGDGISVQSDIGGFLSTTMLAALLGGAAAVLVIVLLLVWMNKKRSRPVPMAEPAPPPGARCRQCGADNKAGARFCRNCGGPLAALAPAAPAEAGKCPRCGLPVGPGKKFCPVCGAPQGAPAAAPAPPAPVQAPPSPPAPEWAAEPAQPAKSNAMLIALSASLILLLLAIVLLVYKLWLRDRAAAPPAAPAQAAAAAPPQTETPAPPGEPVAAEAQPGVPEAAPPQAAAPLAGTQPAQPAGRASPAPSEPVRPSPMPAAAPRTAPATQPAPNQPQPAYQAPVAETPAAPSAPANAAPASAPRQPILRPGPTPAPSTPSAPAAPAYSGPRSGVIIWSGQLEREGRIEISGAAASSGTLRGELPGVPVIVEVEPKDVGVAEAPGPQNGWKSLVLRSRTRRLSVVTMKWTVIQ